MKIDVLENFLPIFFVIWAFFRPATETGKYLNEMRDKILDAKSTYTLENKILIFEDWKGIFIADALYYFFIFLLTLLLSWNFFNKIPNELFPMYLCLFISCISIIRIIRFFQICWFKERVILEKYLKEEKRNSLGLTH